MINHRYHRVKKLGEGGSGQVFLVEDTLKQHRQSAMKILHHEEGPDGLAGEQFKREVSILATLNHPNMVRVFDFGIVRQAAERSLEGCRFLTMEYIQDVPADAWCRGLHSDHERALHLTHIMLQALEVLTYVHRQGIIHFDIKPDNLLLMPGGDKDNGLPLVKLTDFGFSIKKGSPHEFPLRGTLEYTAPELLRREPFDHRIDLYSLGVTLYQLMEDRCPYEAGDPIELIKKVLTTEPEFHRSANAGFAPLLPLLQRLLHKDPAHRVPSAGEATRVLLAAAESTPATVVDHVAKPGFVGRENERKRIGRAITSLGMDRPEEPEVAMLLLGPEGIGKTALLAEMVRFARASDVPVVEANTSTREVPFGTVLSMLPLLRAEVLSRSGDGVELVEKFGDVIDEPPTLPAGDSQEVQSRWMLEREKTIESQARFLIQASLLFPLMLVVDDVDLMDSESGEVLKIAVRDAYPARLLLLLAGSNESSFPAAAARIPLGELDRESVAGMSASVLSPAGVSEAIGNRLFQLYGGTPSTIVEALHSADSILRTETAEESPDIAGLVEKVIARLPRDLDQFLLLRYQSLDRGCQVTLEVLSCFAGAARREVIQAVLPFQSERTAAYLASLEAQELIISYESGQRCAIRHAVLKRLISAAITESRPDTHLFIASTLTGFRGARSFADLQELAYQYTEGGRFADAQQWLEAAADEGTRLSAYQRARELYQKAIDLGTETDTAGAGRLTVKLIQALFNCGAFREAIELANNALSSEHREGSQRIAMHKFAGLAQSRLGEHEEGKGHIIAALEACSDSRERVELAQEMVGIDIALGNFSEAEQACVAQLERVKILGDQRIMAAIYTDLGIATFSQDLFDRSIEYFRESMKIHAASEQRARVADAMMNIGNVMSAKGELTGAIEYWSAALTISQEHGTLNQQGQILNNLGIAHYELKRFEEARGFYADAKAIFGRLESKAGEAFVLTNLGEVEFAEGQYERALVLWRDARRVYRDMEDGRGIVETMLQLAQVHLVLGDMESVAGDLDEAESLTEEKHLETFRAQLLSLRGTRLMVLREYGTARAFFEKSEECSHDGGGSTRRLLLNVRMAECDHNLGMPDAAAKIAGNVLESGEKGSLPQVVAEACYLMGVIARASPAALPDRPIAFFRRGMDAVAEEPVTEVTWKVALALGQEMAERGQRERAKEYLTRAKLVLQFFAGQFTSSELKNQYLAMEKRGETLTALESFLRT